MPIDPRFYRIASKVTSGDLATFLGTKTSGSKDILISDISSPARATSGALTFISSAVHDLGDLAGAVVIAKLGLDDLPKNVGALIEVENPRLEFSRAADMILRDITSDPESETISQKPNIDPSAQIAPTAVIEGNSVIGANVVIGANCVIKSGVHIGSGCHIGDNCTLSHCELAENCTIQAGVVVGGVGFGFEITKNGPVMVPHLGIVRIGRHVGIGANTAIDRGSLDDTVIEDNVMIDNLVHIAHNCHIGAGSVIAGQVGIAGSTTLGRNVMIGGQAGIADHLHIGEGAVIMARSGVTKDVEAGAKMVGFPAMEAGLYWREQALLRQMLRQQKKTKKKD